MNERRRRAYRLAYDGSGYRGFQRQPDVPTVSGAILEALGALEVTTDVPPGYAAAGRTDAGVSAVAQTVAFDAPEWLAPVTLDAELPADIWAWASADVPPDFHATHDATTREYVYYLHAPDADAGPARAALDGLTGRHDFHNLTSDEDGTVRELSGRLESLGPVLVLTLRAGGFPRQLVRRLITVVERVATGGADPGLVDAVLGHETLEGPDGIPPAPPEPLVLTAVEYSDVSFATDPDATEAARAAFRARRSRLAARARVAGRIAAGVRGPDDEASSTTTGEERP